MLNPRRLALAAHVQSQIDELAPPLQARVMAAHSDELFWSGDAERRRKLCDNAVAIARAIGDPHVLADALASHNLMIDLTEPSGFDQIEAQTTEMIDVAAGIDDSLVFDALISRMVARIAQGEVAAGDQDLDRAEQLAERLRIPQIISPAKQMRTARALLAGRLDDTDILLADFEAHSARSGVSSITPAGSIRYRLQYERGELAGLEDFLVMIIEAQPAVPVWRMALCGVYLQTGRLDLVRPHVEAVGADDFAMVPRNQAFLLTCSSTARFAGEVGSLAVAETAYRHASAFDDVFPFPGVVWEVPVGIGVGVAATALGWYDRAEQHYANALALCERADAPTYLASTQVYWAEMLVRRNAAVDAERAQLLATAAHQTSAQLGLKYMHGRAERLLAG